ncbi:hypothetical protein HZH68_012685 [Vespula germanica]|uniref:Uncharacterized protein n=1 Tax=Vespula germanica TaxID=30212 RepID=A0A834MZL1_VESGE|nr:hypothetical protein HZH68_012685 [Vespula germanica]
MSEADGVDGGAICKRGFIHLQFAEKSEAPEAERHLGSWILESHRVEVAACRDPRTNGDSTLKSAIRDAFPLRELQISQQTGDV